jgi:regulator of RNase E activity RraA
MREPRMLKNVTERSLRVKQRMRTAKRPLPNFVLRNKMTGRAITLAVSANKNMMLKTTMF